MYNTEAILQGLQALLTFEVLLFLMLGFLIGFVVGAIPGFNDANLMAILLPFTLLLKPEVAIVSMAAIYAAAQAAGSIPAILMNIPGTPGNAASTIEGYALAKKGRAGYALGIAFGASSFGAFLGAILAFGLAPVLGLFALRFGPAEMFLLAVLGITVVSSLAGNDMIKGLLVAGFGVLLSMIGADDMAGFARATYSIDFLYDGLPLIPVQSRLVGNYFRRQGGYWTRSESQFNAFERTRLHRGRDTRRWRDDWFFSGLWSSATVVSQQESFWHRNRRRFGRDRVR